MIKEELEYKRLSDISYEMISTIWLCIKTGPKENVVVIVDYRQWKYLSEMGIKGSYKLDNN